MTDRMPEWQGHQPSLDSAQLSLSVGAGAGASFPDSGSERSPQQAADQSSDKKSGINGEQLAERNSELLTIKSNNNIIGVYFCITKEIHAHV